ncbi:MAG: NADH-quinone oxidoreductase subunit L [Firmicutes bacterium]|nr:NADH-quinone oxidoreductase subunit L [Bacillota bacterium]
MVLAFIFVPLVGAAMMPIMRKFWVKGSTLVTIAVTLFMLTGSFANILREINSETGISFQKTLLGEKFALSIDGLSAVVLMTIALVTLATIIFSAGVPIGRRSGFNALVLLAVTGMNGLAMATDIFSMYVFVEIVSISSFILIVYNMDEIGTEGSFKYMILSAVATVFLLIGIAALFAVTGDVSFQGVAAGLSSSAPLVRFGLGFIVFALALKSGLMPFHGWLPDAYTAAPVSVSVLLAGVITKVAGVYTLMRIIVAVFGFSESFSNLIMILGALSMTLAAFMALGQGDFKRMLAFSSISQIGYILMSFATGTTLGLIGAVFHFFNHAVFKSLLFLNAGATETATGARRLEDLGGLAAKMPVTGITSIIGMLSAAGIPPLAGFWSKILIIIALWGSGHRFYAGLAVFTSLVTLAYLLHAQRRAFFGKVREGLENVAEVSPLLYGPAVLMAVLAVAAGIFYPVIIRTLNLLLRIHLN